MTRQRSIKRENYTCSSRHWLIMSTEEKIWSWHSKPLNKSGTELRMKVNSFKRITANIKKAGQCYMIRFTMSERLSSFRISWIVLSKEKYKMLCSKISSEKWRKSKKWKLKKNLNKRGTTDVALSLVHNQRKLKLLAQTWGSNSEMNP